MPRRTTVDDVAARAGVSPATVSRVVNGTARVAQNTAESVRRAIADLDFAPTPAARNLRLSRTHNIALIVPSITNPFFPQLVSSIHAELEDRGYSLLLMDREQPELEAARVVRARIADGIVLVGSTEGSPGDAVAVLTSEIPVVAIDRAPETLMTTVVQAENAAGAESVVAHLLARGHRSIAHVAGPPGVGVARDRADGYARALATHGVPHDPRLTAVGDFTEDSGYAVTDALRRNAPPFTALFAANDLMAIGAIAALRDGGARVPEDVAVAGYDGIHLARYVTPRLTTYEQPVAEMARCAVQLLLECIDAGDQAALRPAGGGQRVLRFAGHLRVRESTGTGAPDEGAGGAR